MCRLLSIILLLSLMAAPLMVVSCAREERPSQESAEVAVQEEKKPIQEAAEVTVKAEEKPIQEVGKVAPKAQEMPAQEVERPATKKVAPQTPQRQTRDIMSGKPVNRSIYTDYAGKRVYFCCATSKGQFSAEPEAWLKRSRELEIILEDSPAR
ncbi:MAG: hypothetical protein ABIJ00_05370 [Candidatus Eisenbacteria bacterium]